MFKIKAQIKLYDNVRTRPFSSGYRPVFNFIEEMKTGGNIVLLDRELCYPGDEVVVEIYFLSDRFLGPDFAPGKRFVFGEGQFLTGEGEVLEILDLDAKI
jgi:elongation factor Tu